MDSSEAHDEKRNYRKCPENWRDIAADFISNDETSRGKNLERKKLIQKYDHELRQYTGNTRNKFIARICSKLKEELAALENEVSNVFLPRSLKTSSTCKAGRAIDLKVLSRVLEIFIKGQGLNFQVITEIYLEEMKEELSRNENNSSNLNDCIELYSTYDFDRYKNFARSFCNRWSFPNECAQVSKYYPPAMPHLNGMDSASQYRMFVDGQAERLEKVNQKRKVKQLLIKSDPSLVAFESSSIVIIPSIKGYGLKRKKMSTSEISQNYNSNHATDNLVAPPTGSSFTTANNAIKRTKLHTSAVINSDSSSVSVAVKDVSVESDSPIPVKSANADKLVAVSVQNTVVLLVSNQSSVQPLLTPTTTTFALFHAFSVLNDLFNDKAESIKQLEYINSCLEDMVDANVFECIECINSVICSRSADEVVTFYK
jgi:hypothetical protein